MEPESQGLVLECNKEGKDPLMLEESFERKDISSTSLEKDPTPSQPKSCNESEVEQNMTEDSSHYAEENNKQTVAILYPQSALPLLSANNGELVNLVGLPSVNEVNGSLELDTSLEYESVVLHQNFGNETQIAVMTADQTDNHLGILGSHALQTSSDESVTYFKGDNSSSTNENTILSEQLIHIPSSEVVANGHTITLPLSFVSDSGVSLLQGLSHLPLTFGDDNHGAISMPVNIQASNLIASNEADNQSYILSNISSAPTSNQEANRETVTSKSHISSVSSKSTINSNSSKGILKLIKSSQVGRPPKVQQNKKIIGFGPTAISAQGVVQEINNRLVTVLPRPEDLKKLMDNKQLVFTVRGNTPNSRVGNRRKVSLPVKSHLHKQNDGFRRDSRARKDIVVDMKLPGGNPVSAVLLGEGRTEDDDEDFVPKSVYVKRNSRKRKRGRGRGRGAFVISSTGRRPGRPKKVKTIVEGPKGPRLIQTGPKSYTPSREFKQERNEEDNLKKESNEDEEKENNEGGNINVDQKLIEPVSPSDSLHKDCTPQPTLESDIEEKRRKLPPRNRGVKYKKLIQALKKQEYEDDDFDSADDDEPDDSSRNYLSQDSLSTVSPKVKGTSGPGKRGRPRKNPLPSVGAPGIHALPQQPLDMGGTKIIQLSETLKQIHSSSSSSVLIKDEGGGAAHLQHKLVITFEQPETGEMVIQHIAIQPPPPAPPPPPTTAAEHCNKERRGTPPLESGDLRGANANIVVVPSREDSFEEEIATIFVEENGHYEEGFQCSECGETTQYKRDHIRHLRLKHNLRPYECQQCRKTFTSKHSLQHHTLIHDLEKPHRCNHCGKGFDTPPQLKQHTLEHTKDSMYDCNHCGKSFSSLSSLQMHMTLGEDFNEHRCSKCNRFFPSEELASNHSNCFDFTKSFVCDICRLQFVSSSGLNRHRKVHNRSSNPGSEEPGFRCSTCQASFTFESSLFQHIRLVHDVNVDADEKPPLQSLCSKENSVIEQLQEKLNEGYAPKTSELYDEPDEGETLEQSADDPFNCGVCEEPFKDIDVLCDHYSNSHTGDQPLYCNLCSAGCASDQQMERHKLIHTKEEKLAIYEANPKDTPYVCPLCGKGFKTAQESAKHAKVHTQNKQFKCSFCSASFLIKSALDKHILVHTGQRPYVCDICLKSFRQSAALVRHKLWTHRLKNQNKCEICGKTFFTQNLLLYHLDSHGEEASDLKKRLISKVRTEINVKREREQEEEDGSDLKSYDLNAKRRTCEYCNKECSSLVALLTHKITHKLSASYKCDHCHRTFREKRYLKKHKLTHKGLKVWKCDICKKAFATKLTLIRHSHVHLREALKPDQKTCLISNEGEDYSLMTTMSTLPNELNCEECSIEFVHKSHYVRHKLLHSGIPLLKCGLCDKMFVHKSDIIRHKVMHSFMFTCNTCNRNFHKRSLYILHMKKHMDSKPFKCDKCHKGFASSGNFKIHQRIHSGEKPYQCNMCSYRCSQSGRLLKHKRMHTGEKSASCNVCGKSFSNTESLKSHQRVHTGERPFRCENCEKSFTNSASLNQHMRDHAKEEMYKCDLCNHKFRRNKHLEKHKLFHKMQQQFQKNSEIGLEADLNIDGALYMCDICGRVFDKKKYLFTHRNVHSRHKNFECTVCGKQLASRLALKNHGMIHTGEMPHKCNYCEKEFRSLSNLKRHEKVHCSQEMFNCEECGETLYSLDLLNDHKQVHVNLMMINSEVGGVNTEVSQQLYVFDTVDDSMNETIDPTQQLIVENTQQQFLVDNSQSLLVFPESTNDAYTEIPATHASEPDKPEESEPVPPSPQLSSREEEIDQDTQSSFIMPEKISDPPVPSMVEETEVDKPHQCDVCFKYFAKKQYLTKHKYRHREVKPHPCEICGKRFAQKFEVAVHKIKHTGERPYQCEICKKEFRSKVNLINHRMRHTGEYPYLCSVCNKGLSTQLQLERHVSLHTGAHPFRCHLCNKGYFQRISLIRHLSKGHNIETDEENFENAQPLDTSENMEVMKAISTIANMPQLTEDKQEISEFVAGTKIKQENEIEVSVEPMDMSTMEELGETQFSVVPEQPDYLLGAPQEIDSKFLSSILQQVRVDEADCDADSEGRNDQDLQ